MLISSICTVCACVVIHLYVQSSLECLYAHVRNNDWFCFVVTVGSHVTLEVPPRPRPIQPETV